MQILSAEQTRATDAHTIEQEPIASIDLMERASQHFCRWFVPRFPNSGQTIHIFCGVGNNGGDGLAVARILKGRGYAVKVYLVKYANKLSADCQINLDRLKQFDSIALSELSGDVSQIIVSHQDMIIDSMFGSGLSRPIEGFTAELIEQLNELPGTRVAIDIPSGVYADKLPDGVVFKAHYTCSFQRPKLSFFLPEYAEAVGEWHVIDIGLDERFISKQDTRWHCITPADLTLKQRGKYSHKGTYGHALIIGGSYGSIGAALMAGKACLRTGAGLVTSYVPRCGYNIIQTAFPEAMVLTDMHQEVITHLPEQDKYAAIGVGPGLGTNELTTTALHQLIEQSDKPMVIDADALNILAKNQEWFELLPANTILTPHPKEFERLFGATNNSLDRLKLAREKAQQYNIIICLKGAHTAVALPDGTIWFNTTGNSGMATGGSGDVLTGIITGLLSQGYQPARAALIGVYLHGLAGNMAAVNSLESMIAEDIIQHIGPAYVKLNNDYA